MPPLHHLTPQLLSSDLTRSIDFYTRALGFTLEGTWPDEKPDWCMLGHGDVRIMFTTGAHNDPAGPKFTGKISLQTDDVLAIHARVQGHAPIAYGPEVYHYGMHEFAILDPDGYMLSFGQETDAPPSCAGA